MKSNQQIARDKGLDLSRVVFDGCLKLCGRVCGRPAAEMVHCPELSLYTTCPCSRQPQFKKRRCAEHDCSKPVAGPLLDEVAGATVAGFCIRSHVSIHTNYA